MGVDRLKIRWNGWGWAAHKDELGGREAVWTWLAGELGMPALLATPARPLDELSMAPPALYVEDRKALIGILGADRLHEDTYERAFHALGRSYHDLLRLRAGDLSTAPDAVVYPRGTDEVLAVLALAAEHGIAVIPFGGGTSAVGGVSAARGTFHSAITVDLSAMDRLIEIDPVSATATAEAGITGPALEKALQARGFTLGHHPQSFEFSTLGGWIAHRGSGQGARRYGRAEDWLVGAKLATPRGLLSTGDFPASAAGPQLKDLVLGSEGIFGIVTEATMRLREVPKVCDYRSWLFPDFESGMAAVREASQNGLEITVLRLSDAEETRFTRLYGELGKPSSLPRRLVETYLELRGFDDKACALIAGFEGDALSVAQARKQFGAMAHKHGAQPLGRGPGEAWRQARFQAPYLRDPMLDRGLGVDTLETNVSWPKLAALYAATRAALEAAILKTVPREGAKGIVMCTIADSYADGASLCFTCIFPRALDGDIAQWKAIKLAASEAIVANGGTISHQHGVGEDHAAWIAQEKGPVGIAVLRGVKQVLDPAGVLNPGKLLPG